MLKDCSIFARGAGQQIRGIKHGSYRPDLVVLDDLENDKLAINPKRVKFLLRWILGTVYPGISRDGGLMIIGTIIDRRSALATMLNSPEEPWCLWRRKLYGHHPEGESLGRPCTPGAAESKRPPTSGENMGFCSGAWAHGKDPGPALGHRPGGQGALSLECGVIVESLAELNPCWTEMPTPPVGRRIKSVGRGGCLMAMRNAPHNRA